MPSSSQLSSLLRKILPTSTSSRIRSFSSHPSTATITRKRWSCFSDEIPEESETSSVYNHALKFQRPSTIKYGDNSVNNRSLNLQWPSASTYTKQPVNSVSLIGTVVFPLKRVQKPDEFGVHTVLRVQTSPRSKSSFWILLKMWGEMAEISINHLKPNDFVYVSGRLGSYVKADKNGNPGISYEVVVKELNYVAQHGEKLMHQQHQKLDLQGDDYIERQRNRFHLWQVFFANPYEWRDFRMSKKNPKHPDFKNITTGEALWLDHNDPPWIKRQLQFLDSVLAGRSRGDGDTSPTSFSSLCQ